MGLLDKLSNYLGSRKKDINLLLVGLDNSGKTSIVNLLKPQESRLVNVIPTVGFSVEKFTSKGIHFTAFDMSGQSRYRNLWEHYYKDADVIICVIDSSDRMRIVVANEELKSMLNHPEMKQKNIPILFFANKSDVRGACSASELKVELELDKIKNKTWHIFSSNALTGEGVQEGFEWLSQQLKTN